MQKKVYYIANARMPSEKAHGIQIAKMCEAFLEEDLDVTLVVPHRGTSSQSLKDFYGLRVEVPVNRLPALDLYNYEQIGYRISSYSFMFSYTLFLLGKKARGEKFVLYTVDLDNFSSSALASIGAPLFTEMHGGKPNTFSQRTLFRALKGVITINTIIRDELRAMFPKTKTAFIVEPNGVDERQFEPLPKEMARTKLGIPADKKIVLYTGRFFEWKGLEIISEAARKSEDINWYVVGGTAEEFKSVTKCFELPKNIIFPGAVPHAMVSTWLSAADALLVLGTARDVQSYQHTSPMKLFEYFVAARPIIASGTPAIRSIVSDTEVQFYEPDNAEDLAAQAIKIIDHPENFTAKVAAAKLLGAAHSWSGRASRITDFIKNTV
jgi:glycosyltransferase involved in cell wall biosynthesis